MFLAAGEPSGDALGAALIGLDDYRREHREELEGDDALEAQMALDKACVPGCRGVPELAAAPPATAPRGNAAALWKRIQSHL